MPSNLMSESLSLGSKFDICTNSHGPVDLREGLVVDGIAIVTESYRVGTFVRVLSLWYVEYVIFPKLHVYVYEYNKLVMQCSW